MNEASAVDTQYTIWQNDRSSFTCSVEDGPIIDRAMKLWAESRRDSWISVHGPTGAEFSLLASTVNSATTTTAQSRMDATQLDKALADELREHRRLAGFIESE